VFLTLRQQAQKTKGAPIRFIFYSSKRFWKDRLYGCFCVTTGFGVDEWAAEFEKDLDDYNSIMVKHWQTVLQLLPNIYKERKEIWGYAADEVLSTDDMIAETYKGIRPALLSACPDHLEKPTIWKLLNVEEGGDIDREYGNVARIISIRLLFWGNPVSISDLER
jgi:5-methyltetrahydrofolate--homocysteine methyltransferase